MKKPLEIQKYLTVMDIEPDKVDFICNNNDGDECSVFSLAAEFLDNLPSSSNLLEKLPFEATLT